MPCSSIVLFVDYLREQLFLLQTAGRNCQLCDRLSDHTLAEAEAVLKDCGFDYPLAWAMSFLHKNSPVLKRALQAFPMLHSSYIGLLDWIENGDPELRDE